MPAEAYRCPCCNRPVFLGSFAGDPDTKMGIPGGRSRPWSWRSMTKAEVMFLLRLLRKRVTFLEAKLKEM